MKNGLPYVLLKFSYSELYLGLCSMRILSKRTLREFWETHNDCEQQLLIWCKEIQNEKDYLKALARLDVIFDSKNEDSTFDEAELLVMLVENYETETEPVFPEPDPIEVIKYKMDQNNLKNKDLAEIIGGKSKVSEILSKKRRLTLSMIRRINKAYGISAETLIQDYELVN